jgi:AraC family transcriptional regulator of adaptative response / DNA-3-methyladenine glycosylase II
MDLDHDACYRAIVTRDARFDGRIFIAVKTTKIYCRPICPARPPKSENVVFYPSAAAAQSAGFRPCLRCRPETAPELAAWRGTSNTIARALTLIEGGALDENDVDSLATRLGVGERHLRRLFDQHLGASPIAVAQTRRVLLAKQLIHETTLPMTQVALAAGFGSIRRFNETFSRMFGRAPSTLRRISASGDSQAASGTTLLLRYKPPYDWQSMFAFLRMRSVTGMESAGDNSYSRSIDLGGVHGIITVEPASGHALKATISMPKLTALPAIIARIRRVFDLAADPQLIGAHLSEDPVMAELVKTRPGLRVPGAWDGFELAVRAVLGQQITVRGAIQLASRLVAEYGAPLTMQSAGHPTITHAFPRPEVMAAADLASLGMPGARAKSLSSLAAAVVADPQIFSAKRSLEETIAQLRNLAGVGEWTAQYIAMRELREPDAFPAADIGLMRALVDATGQRPDARELLQRAERWRPWRAYAAQQLWAADAHALAKAAKSPAKARAKGKSGKAAARRSAIRSPLRSAIR